MGLINDIVSLYKISNEEKKKNVVEKFIKLIWKSPCEYRSIESKIQFEIDDTKVDEGLFDILCKYSDLKYKRIKSKYRPEEMSPIDYIRVHINNSYAFLFDERVYATKEYVYNLLQPRDAYFKYIQGKITREELLFRLEEFEVKNVNNRKKYKLSWNEYKKMIDSYILRIFENIKSVDQILNEIEFEHQVNKEDFDYDNILISYINNCITGYLRHYIRQFEEKEDVLKYCVVCGKEIEGGNRKKYCCECFEMYRRKYKTNKQKEYRLRVDR